MHDTTHASPKNKRGKPENPEREYGSGKS